MPADRGRAAVARWLFLAALATAGCAGSGTPRAFVPDEQFFAEARRLAEEAVEQARDDEHKEDHRVVWSNGAPGALPETFDVYLVGSTWTGIEVCTLIRLKDGRARVNRLTLGRWHPARRHPAGDFIRGEALTVSERDVMRAWVAADLIRRAHDEQTAAEPLGNAAIFGIDYGPLCPADCYMQLRRDVPPKLVVRAGTDKGSLCVARPTWPDIQVRAILVAFGKLLPEPDYGSDASIDELVLGPDRSRPTLPLFDESDQFSPPSGEIDAETWGPWLTREVQELLPAVESGEGYVDGGGNSLMGISLRILGQIGDEDALPAIRAVEERLGADEERLKKRSYSDWVYILHKAREAELRIRMRHHWDSAEARRIILEETKDAPVDEFSIRSVSWDDRVRWMRQRWFENDPEGYRVWLLAEVASPTSKNTRFLCQQINELAACYPGQGLDELEKLLDHPRAAVAANAAHAILQSRPRDAKAVAWLDRLATTVTAGSDGSDYIRGAAFRYLFERGLPESNPWDVKRIRDHVLNIPETPTMIRIFTKALEERKKPLTPEEDARVWSRALKEISVPVVE